MFVRLHMHNKWYAIQQIHSATTWQKYNLDGQFRQNIFTTHLFLNVEIQYFFPTLAIS